MYVSSSLNLFYEANCRYLSFHCAKVELFDSSLPAFMVLPIILRTHVQQQTQWAAQSVLLHGGNPRKGANGGVLGTRVRQSQWQPCKSWVGR